MLEFVLGRAGTGKTTRLREWLTAEKSGARDLVVPEQYHVRDRARCSRPTAWETANRVKVYSFLHGLPRRRSCATAGRRASATDGGRRILMTLAIEACADQLTLFEKSAAGGRTTDVMLTAVGEMKLCGIAPDRLI